LTSFKLQSTAVLHEDSAKCRQIFVLESPVEQEHLITHISDVVVPATHKPKLFVSARKNSWLQITTTTGFTSVRRRRTDLPLKPTLPPYRVTAARHPAVRHCSLPAHSRGRSRERATRNATFWSVASQKSSEVRQVWPNTPVF